MAEILQFPDKKSFTDRMATQFRGEIPKDTLECLLSAYHRVNELQKKYPSAQLMVYPESKTEITKLIENYEEYSLVLLKRILELEAELCFSQIK
jgi:quinolinate synthase